MKNLTKFSALVLLFFSFTFVTDVNSQEVLDHSKNTKEEIQDHLQTENCITQALFVISNLNSTSEKNNKVRSSDDYEIHDPCSCLENANINDLDTGMGGDDGQFSETVTITAAGGEPLPDGMTWTIVGCIGGFDAFNVPSIGTQSGGVAIATDGTVLLANNSGIYEIPFVHVDDIGYTMSIEGPFAMGSAANVTLTISNKCEYPDPVFDPVLPNDIMNSDPEITLGGEDINGGTHDAITFTIDASAAVTFDPSDLAIGNHTVMMTFDGAADGNGGISPDGGTTAARPGCIQEVQKVVEVISVPLAFQVASTDYETLSEAITAAGTMGTIFMIDDFIQSSDITIPVSVTLVVSQEHTLTVNGLLTNNGTIKNESTINHSNSTFVNNGTYKGSGTFSGDFENDGIIEISQND